MYDETDVVSDDSYVEDVVLAENRLVESFESLQRLMDNYTALSGLAELHGKLDSESFEASANAVMSAVLAGTDIDPADIVYSPESLSTLLKNAWKAILEALKNFVKDVIKFMENLDIAALWLSRRMRVVERTRAASRGKLPTSSTVEIGRMYRYLRVGRVYIEDPIRLQRELDKLYSAIKTVNTTYFESISQATTRLHNARGKYGKELDDALVNCVLSIPWEVIDRTFGMSALSGTNKFGRPGVRGTDPLLGGITIYRLDGNLGDRGTVGFRYHGIITEDSTEEVFNILESREFKTIQAPDMAGIPDLVIKILEGISSGTQKSAQEKMKRMMTNVESFIKQASTDEKITESDMKAIRRFSSALSYWSHSASRRLYSTSMGVSRAVLTYCEKSIKTYR